MKTNRIFTAFLAVIGLVSCKDMLNIAPANQIASENMWSNESLADKGMAGLYVNFYREDLSRTQLRYNDFTGINRQGWMGMEFMCDMTVDNYPLMALADATKDATEFIVWYEWKWAYTSIHQINDALANLHKAGLRTDKYERYMCEAKFLRAWFYSRLNRIYGGMPSGGPAGYVPGGVPLYLEVISQEQCTRSQSSAGEVWKAVIKDLDDCIGCANFPDNTLTANYGRPSKGAAYALRGMAYMYLEDYKAAAEDFEKVSQCGYGLWQGKYIDFFRYENEKDHEMIFPLQFGEDTGYCDNLQLLLGGRDTWNGWSNVRPSSDFVDYFQNADGTEFKWSEVPGLEDWDMLEPYQREVFFLRDGYRSRKWTDAQKSTFDERIAKIGQDIFDRYYLDEGNEARIRKAYDNRDPRLKDIVLVPYDPYDTFKDASDNGGKIQYGKELRWPFLNEGDDGGDYYIGSFNNKYQFKKYSYNRPEDLIDRLRCQTDWPLIRYTDVALLLAECHVQNDRIGDAMAIVNDIRSRAGMPAASAGSKAEAMEAVRYERRIELCLEGHDWFDEWRWGTCKDMKFQGRDTYGGQSWWKEWEGFDYNWYYTADMYPWAAPSSECQRNPNMVKKAGWSY
ncbi:MAG: RagB/SusD family nutrient uptake outer membrane protein [Clostridium sp.]|nr:RagB/SusD family nutrient uptake outer membrane protein [Bacteroides sp.]MCM1197283.1 RagB/SusD family nutrient uptake outer membrane protein [Clostridium sp.]